MSALRALLVVLLAASAQASQLSGSGKGKLPAVSLSSLGVSKTYALDAASRLPIPGSLNAALPAIPANAPALLGPQESAQSAETPEKQPALETLRAADGGGDDRNDPAQLALERFDGAVSKADLEPTENGLVRVTDLESGRAALRKGSRAITPEVEGLIRTLAEHHPTLPISPERLYLISDPELLRSLGLPLEAAGAARILSDGTREAKIVIVNGVRAVPFDDFVEFAIHEAVHLFDEGILRVPHDAEQEHWFAEGYTQLRAHAMANESLHKLGRRERAGWQAYSSEVELVLSLIKRHGTEPLEALVRRGDPSLLARALGPRWEFMRELFARRAAGERVPREKMLIALKAIIEATRFGPEEKAAVREYLF